MRSSPRILTAPSSPMWPASISSCSFKWKRTQSLIETTLSQATLAWSELLPCSRTCLKIHDWKTAEWTRWLIPNLTLKVKFTFRLSRRLHSTWVESRIQWTLGIISSLTRWRKRTLPRSPRCLILLYNVVLTLKVGFSACHQGARDDSHLTRILSAHCRYNKAVWCRVSRLSRAFSVLERLEILKFNFLSKASKNPIQKLLILRPKTSNHPNRHSSTLDRLLLSHNWTSRSSSVSSTTALPVKNSKVWKHQMPSSWSWMGTEFRRH